VVVKGIGHVSFADADLLFGRLVPKFALSVSPPPPFPPWFHSYVPPVGMTLTGSIPVLVILSRPSAVLRMPGDFVSAASMLIHFSVQSGVY